jgi:hypothetical protein
MTSQLAHSSCVTLWKRMGSGSREAAKGAKGEGDHGIKRRGAKNRAFSGLLVQEG